MVRNPTRKAGDGMNPGYMSWIWIVISLILLASGWKDVLLKGVTAKAIRFFFIVWCLLMAVHFPIGKHVLYPIFFFLFILYCAALLSGEHAQRRLQMAFLPTFLGILEFMLRQTSGAAVLMLPDSSLLLAAAAVLLVRPAVPQIAVISMSELVCLALTVYVHKERLPLTIGDMRFQDHWWLAVCSARLTTVAVEHVGLVVKTGFYSWVERGRDRRK